MKYLLIIPLDHTYPIIILDQNSIKVSLSREIIYIDLSVISIIGLEFLVMPYQGKLFLFLFYFFHSFIYSSISNIISRSNSIERRQHNSDTKCCELLAVLNLEVIRCCISFNSIICTSTC